MPTFFNATGLVKNYNARSQPVRVIKEVSFGIEKNDFLIIYGPSGCGKSTLLHILLCLLPPSSGSMIIDKIDVYKNLTEEQRTLFRKKYFGMVFQQSNWIKSLTVAENIAFPMILSGMPRLEAGTKSNKLLADVGMSEFADYYPDELSSGQQQKVAIARAISTDPQVIVADEPTGNLDRKSGAELMELLSRFNKLGKTIIMVTHDTNYLIYATVALEMLDGRIIKVLDKKDIKKVIITERSLIKS